MSAAAAGRSTSGCGWRTGSCACRRSRSPTARSLDFGQVLHWNRQTRMARFACTRSGDIWVQADLPAEAVSAELLDRLLGLVVEGALNVRAYASRL